MTRIKKFIPDYPLIRPRKCPSGPPMHPVNRANPDKCPLSRLMSDIGASEGVGGLATNWTQRSFTKTELTTRGFTVAEKPGQRPQARCDVCGLEMSLRRAKD